MNDDLNNRLRGLLQAVAQGDTQAFRHLYDESSPHLYAIAMQMMQVSSAASDVLQDAFVQIWHRAEDYHAERGTVMAWLTTIVRYRAIDMLRKNRNDAPLDPETIDALTSQLGSGTENNPGGPFDEAISDERDQYLAECISRLSGSQKQSVALAFFHGMTHQELSTCLEMPLGTIKSRLRRSLSRLKTCLEKLGFIDAISTGTD